MLESLLGGCGTQCGGCCFGLVVILLLCCVLGGGAAYYVYTEGPEPPLTDSFKPSTAEAQAFQNQIDYATAQARNNPQGAWLNFTERQIASWMALEGQDYANEHGHDFPFKNVQVALGDGQITFYGELQRLGLALPLMAVVEPSINTSGEMTFEITSVDIGGVSLPHAVLRTISRQFEDVLVQPFNDLQGTPFFYKDSLTIQDGNFAVWVAVN
jgi:hypothetical protein